jgi:uncharacterized protein with HEPN domain
MFDRELVTEILMQIDKALETIIYRFEPVKSISDFTDSPQGMEKLDSICMLFIAVGESLKQIDKITTSELLVKYPEIDWKGVKGFRDIISHHYFDVDAEEVFWICSKELTHLSKTIKQIITDL